MIIKLHLTTDSYLQKFEEKKPWARDKKITIDVTVYII